MLKKLCCLLLGAVGIAQTAGAFSLIGLRPDWQTDRRGYSSDFGPMNIGEEYRWNVPTVYYGFDNSFLEYFGAKGVEEIDKAFQILNSLPSMSSARLDDFPFDTRRPNSRAQALNLLDLKSTTLGFLMANIGLESPIRYVFTLGDVIDAPCCNLFVMKRRNFDPDTLMPTSFINGRLWTYRDIFCICTPIQIAFPVNTPVDPLAYNEPVAASFDLFSRFAVGQFYTGLTRDDVGGLKYIYNRGNQNYETIVGGVVGTGGGPWGGVGGTNLSNFATNGIRSGVDRVTFVRLDFDSLIGETLQPITNSFDETVITQRGAIQQSIGRIVAVPDILFAAADTTTRAGFTITTTVGPNGEIASETISFTESSPIWALIAHRFIGTRANPVINGAIAAGPALLAPGHWIVFNNAGPQGINDPFFVAETNAVPVYTWGSFDSSTNISIYPFGASIEDLERQILSTGGGIPWGP